jgi:heme/copper-type cytochrome/quinol oxidase subunit 4
VICIIYLKTKFKFLFLKESNDRRDERSFQLLEGPSSQPDNTTSKTKNEKLHSLLNGKNHSSTEQSFNNLNNSMLLNLNVLVHSLDNCQLQPKPKMTSHVDVLEMVQRKAEIKASITSLITNLVLGVSIILILIHFQLTTYFEASETSNAILIILLKGLIPIVTAISNFVKMQEVLELYWNKYNPFN